MTSRHFSVQKSRKPSEAQAKLNTAYSRAFITIIPSLPGVNEEDVELQFPQCVCTVYDIIIHCMYSYFFFNKTQNFKSKYQRKQLFKKFTVLHILSHLFIYLFSFKLIHSYLIMVVLNKSALFHKISFVIKKVYLYLTVYQHCFSQPFFLSVDSGRSDVSCDDCPCLRS